MRIPRRFLPPNLDVGSTVVASRSGWSWADDHHRAAPSFRAHGRRGWSPPSELSKVAGVDPPTPPARMLVMVARLVGGPLAVWRFGGLQCTIACHSQCLRGSPRTTRCAPPDAMLRDGCSHAPVWLDCDCPATISRLSPCLRPPATQVGCCSPVAVHVSRLRALSLARKPLVNHPPAPRPQHQQPSVHRHDAHSPSHLCIRRVYATQACG